MISTVQCTGGRNSEEIWRGHIRFVPYHRDSLYPCQDFRDIQEYKEIPLNKSLVAFNDDYLSTAHTNTNIQEVLHIHGVILVHL